MSSRVDLAIVCDFDGTIALDDVGNAFFRTFARPPWDEVVRDWEEGRIGSRECLEKECSLTSAGPEDLERFAAEQRIDPSFSDLVRWAGQKCFPVAVVSDGFKEYIRTILERHGLAVPTFANRVRFEDRRPVPEFPYHGLGCPRCANCKGYHVRRFREAGFRTVFIGDGLSDLCALPYADVILAKGDLADHCRTHRIRHRRVQNLGEALAVLQDLAGEVPAAR